MKTDKKMKKDKKFLEYLEFRNKDISTPQKGHIKIIHQKKKKTHQFEQVPIGHLSTNCTSK